MINEKSEGKIMKKILSLSILLALTTGASFAASDFGKSLKNAVKSDIQTMKNNAKQTNSDLKNAVKADIEAKKAEAKAQQLANQKEAAAKKEAKIKEVEKQISALKKELNEVNSSTTITRTEKTLRTKAINKKIEIYNKQLEALK